MNSRKCTVKSITALHWLVDGPGSYAAAEMGQSKIVVAGRRDSVGRTVSRIWDRKGGGEKGGGVKEKVSKGIVKSFSREGGEAELLRGVDMATVSLL